MSVQAKAKDMFKLEWDDRFSVGVPTIDGQHKRLIELISNLSVAVAAGKGRDVVGQVLGEVVNYTVSHFQTEEKLMQTHQYPEYTEHKKAHDTLVQQASDLVSKQKSGSLFISGEVMNFLESWLTHHISGTDKKLGAYLQAKGIK